MPLLLALPHAVVVSCIYPPHAPFPAVIVPTLAQPCTAAEKVQTASVRRSVSSALPESLPVVPGSTENPGAEML